MALDMHRKALEKKGHKKRSIEEEEILKRIITPDHPIDPLELLGERSFNEPRDIPREEIGTPVQEFFRDTTIFLTGGTGFMGKMLIEKLLRSCPHIKHIYLLVRVKKGKTAHERIDDIFQDRLFKRLRYEVPKFYHKVSVINGDIEQPGLGISAEDREKLSEEVNVIFHGAATVRFDEKLRIAVGINVLGTREIMKLAKSVKNLKVVMHVSTAYSFCPRSEVEEKFYTCPEEYEKVIEKVKLMSDDEIDCETSKLIHDWPNTYTFTKALAECLIQKESQGLPIGIFRPSVIVSTYREPVRGWIDNVYGPIGVIVGIGTGILRVYEGNLDTNSCDMVPVDLVVNGLICAAQQTADKYKNSTKIETDTPIYIFSSGIQNPITWRRILDYSAKHGMDWPTIRAVWYYSLTVTENRNVYTILSFLLHTLPGYVLDFFAVLLGEKPMLTKIYQKLDNVRDILEYFRIRNWTFKNENTQELWRSLSQRDKELFFFDMSTISWEYFLKAMCLGLRVYLINDDIHTIPAARKKWRRLYYAHTTLKYLFFAFVIFALWTMIKFVFFLSI